MDGNRGQEADKVEHWVMWVRYVDTRVSGRGSILIPIASSIVQFDYCSGFCTIMKFWHIARFNELRYAGNIHLRLGLILHFDLDDEEEMYLARKIRHQGTVGQETERIST